MDFYSAAGQMVANKGAIMTRQAWENKRYLSFDEIGNLVDNQGKEYELIDEDGYRENDWGVFINTTKTVAARRG